MIVVTVELLSARTGKRSTLGVAEIYNDATGTASVGNYVAKVYRKGERRGGRVWKGTAVKGFPRKRLPAWDLLYRALRDIVGERNP